MIRAKVTMPKNKLLVNKDSSAFYRRAGDYMVSSTKAKINAGIKPGNAPLTRKIKKNNLPLRDSGGLLSSFHSKIEADGVSVSTSHPAARINQEGGTITPKRAKRLAVPAGDKTRTLMRRFGATPRLCIDRMKAAGWKIWVVKGTIMAQETKRSKAFPLFFLKAKIKIPKRKFLFISKQDQAIIRAMFMNEMIRRP